MECRRGSILLVIMIMSAVLMVLAVILVKMVYNNCVTQYSFMMREEAFWLAEAGLQWGKVEIKRNAGWYTDLPHYPADDIEWLKTGAAGKRMRLENGIIKVVRERHSSAIYAVGIKQKAVVVLKSQEKAWKEL